MAERRQAVRRQPIEIEVEDGRVFVARPLPWTEASDFANEVVRQNTEAMNEFVRLYVDEETNVPQLEMKYHQKISDWQSVLRLAFPDVEEEKWTQPRILSSDECADLVLAACEVNHLEHLKHLIDPNYQTPMNPGGTDSSGDTKTTDGTKTPSSPDLSVVGSGEKMPST